ncbi:hypothetical protein QUF90_01800 [Desulfococcaceae bacterium HSG9]|nr:hypothetical protein [Desulfococcaceae bacterium HSG9]
MQTQCITIETHAKYIFNCLAPDEREQAEYHFAQCDECLEKLIINRELLEEIDLAQFDPAPSNLIQPALGKIFDYLKTFREWLTDLAQPPWLGSVATVRSGKDSAKTVSPGAVLVKKEMQDLQVEIYIEKLKESRVALWIHVSCNKRPAPNVYLSLKQASGATVARLLNHDYECFDNIPYGRYSLKLEQKEAAKGIYAFKIDDRGLHER